MWVLCHVSENTLGRNRDLMEDSAAPSNLSILKVPEPDWAAISARAKKGSKPGEHVQLFHMKQDRNRASTLKSANWKASIALCFEWAGYVVPWDVVQHFTILLLAPNGVSNEHCCSKCTSLGPNCSLDTGGGGYCRVFNHGPSRAVRSGEQQ